LPLGTEVGLAQNDIVLHVDPASPYKRHSPPIFGPCLLWPNGCMYQDTTWYGGRPQSRRHCVRWGKQLSVFVFMKSSMFLLYRRACNALCLCIGNVEEMTQVPGKTNRDVAWMTHSCVLGYDVVGKTRRSSSCSSVLPDMQDSRQASCLLLLL